MVAGRTTVAPVVISKCVGYPLLRHHGTPSFRELLLSAAVIPVGTPSSLAGPVYIIYSTISHGAILANFPQLLGSVMGLFYVYLKDVS